MPAFLSASSLTDAAQAHDHSASAEQVIELGALHGKLRFDKEQFTVSPGARVQLVFKNTDEMQHNLLICRPGRGVTMNIAQKAWALGADAQKKQFVPDDPAVLWHTRVLNPGESDTLRFTAPTEEGDYPYVCTLPGHAFTMKGVMRVGAPVVDPKLKDVVYFYYEGDWRDRLPNFEALRPTKIHTLATNLFDLAVAGRAEYFALQFFGEVNAPADGNYSFWVASDDGAKLFVDDQLVVDNDGHHAVVEKQATRKLTKGAHQLRLEYFQADGGRGLQVAWQGPGFNRTPLTPRGRSRPDVDREKFHLHVMNEPLGIRSFIDGGPSRSIAVGLPGAVNYCFNAETCAVQFGWLGMFLDVGPDRGYGVDRGGGWSKILGERFEVGNSGFPLRVGHAEHVPRTRFLGYRRVGTPQFMFEVNGLKVTQTVRPVPATAASQFGLQFDFAFERALGDVFFKADPGAKHIALSSATPGAKILDGNLVKIPAATAQKFSVIVIDHSKFPSDLR